MKQVRGRFVVRKRNNTSPGLALAFVQASSRRPLRLNGATQHVFQLALLNQQLLLKFQYLGAKLNLGKFHCLPGHNSFLHASRKRRAPVQQHKRLRMPQLHMANRDTVQLVAPHTAKRSVRVCHRRPQSHDAGQRQAMVPQLVNQVCVV
jgi:hypothetical protein